MLQEVRGVWADITAVDMVDGGSGIGGGGSGSEDGESDTDEMCECCWVPHWFTCHNDSNFKLVGQARKSLIGQVC